MPARVRNDRPDSSSLWFGTVLGIVTIVAVIANIAGVIKFREVVMDFGVEVPLWVAFRLNNPTVPSGYVLGPAMLAIASDYVAKLRDIRHLVLWLCGFGLFALVADAAFVIGYPFLKLLNEVS